MKEFYLLLFRCLINFFLIQFLQFFYYCSNNPKKDENQEEIKKLFNKVIKNK